MHVSEHCGSVGRQRSEPTAKDDLDEREKERPNQTNGGP